jgi:TPP-dependent pyruvate/acetoin dehydrogenase alpha subunit
MTEAELLAFEEDIVQEFAAGKIKSPVHLSQGNEWQLIKIFERIKPWDWMLCGWRSHYHCLLKGVPPAELKAAIMAGHSVSLCFKEQKILCSGICGGIAPIAVGIACTLKKRNDEDYTGNNEKVFCFLGDMTAETGIVHEAMKYAAYHRLPVEWIIEDNGQSVCTDTRESWGDRTTWTPPWAAVQRYIYKLGRPHAGIGQWVKF